MQRFKPLPSIGSTHQIQSDGADSAVDLTSPSPTTSTTEIRASSVSTRTITLRSDRKHSHLRDSRSSSREGRFASKAAKIDTKPPIVTTTQATASDEGRVRRTRGSSKTKAKSKLPASELNVDALPELSKDDPHGPNFEIPPEPSEGAPHTVILKLRLPGGECIQRRFSYQLDRLGCVVRYACSVVNSNPKSTDMNLSVSSVTLSSNSVPKIVYSDLSLTLEQAGLVHNTVLHLDFENL